MTTFTFTGYSDNTDVGSVAGGWARLSGASGGAIVNSDGKVDFVSTDATGVAYGIDVGSANHSFEIKYGTASNDGLYFPCCIRMADADNFIGARFRLGEIQVWERAAGTLTSKGAYTLASIASGDRLKVSASSNLISVYFNDSLVIGPVTISAGNTNTKIGFVARSGAQIDLIDEAYTTPDVPGIGLAITSVTPTDVYSQQVDVVVAGTKLSNSATVTFAGAACTGLSASGSTSLKITMPNFYTNNIKVGTVRELKIIG